MVDFFCPFACLYARNQLLGEKLSLSIIEAGVTFSIDNDAISVVLDQDLLFKFDSKEVLNSIIESFNNSLFLELMKQGDLANFKSRKTLVDFFDKLIAYYFEQSITIQTFCLRLKKIVLDEKQVNTKCSLWKLYNGFAKNIIEPASFEQIVKIFISKLITRFSSSKYEENIDIFLKNYQLN